MMVMVEGQAATAEEELTRSVIIISGTIYLPRAFNVTNHCFVRDEDRHAPELPLPSDVRIQSRRNLVANRFMCIDECSSDRWMRQLIEEFSTMVLYSVEDDPIWDDGTILSSRIWPRCPMPIGLSGDTCHTEHPHQGLLPTPRL